MLPASSTGVSIYFPPNQQLLDADYLQIPAAASWSQFLAAYYQAGPNIPLEAQPAVVDNIVDASLYFGAYFSLEYNEDETLGIADLPTLLYDFEALDPGLEYYVDITVTDFGGNQLIASSTFTLDDSEGGSEDDGEASGIDSTAAAQEALLTLSDLPAGWSEGPIDAAADLERRVHRRWRLPGEVRTRYRHRHHRHRRRGTNSSGFPQVSRRSRR